MSLSFLTKMPPRQKASGKLLAGFFALMLVLTLLTRGLSALTIPRVTASRPGRGELARDLSFSGQLESVGSLPVTVPAGYEIGRLLVEEGGEVKEGEILAVLDLDRLREQLREANRALEKARLNAQLSAIEDEKAVLDGIAAAERALRHAEEDLAATRDESDRAVDRATANLSTAYRDRRKLEKDGYEEEELDEIKERIRSLQQDLIDAEAGALTRERSAERLVDDARIALEEAEEAEALRLQNLSLDGQRKALEARISALELESEQEKVAEIQALIESEGIIRAPSGGVVTELRGSVGNDTPGGALLLLSDESMGSRVRLMVKEDEAKHLTRGDTVQIDTGVWGQSLTGVISSIVAPEKKGGESEITVLIPEGAPEPGTTVRIQVRQRGEAYRTVIPLSALHSQNNSTTSGYVMVVRERPTIMGVQLVAERVPVQIVDQNDTSAAIEGVFDPDDRIITASSRAITDGDQVRLEGSE